MAGKLNMPELIKALEAEFDLDHGFLGQLRQGNFDPSGLQRLITLLESIDLGDELAIDRRLVSLLWMLPTFMEWQVERVAENGGDIVQLRHGVDRVQGILQLVLGMP